MSVQNMVTEFHRLYGQPVGNYDQPAMLTNDRTCLRRKLVAEEFLEACEAQREGLPALAQELADLVYVVYGWAIELGVDLDPIIQEVHFSNMSKLDDNGLPVIRDDGKVMKTDNYFPPDVESVIAQQGTFPRWLTRD